VPQVDVGGHDSGPLIEQVILNDVDAAPAAGLGVGKPEPVVGCDLADDGESDYAVGDPRHPMPISQR
jgi:hypothetical protein